MKLESKKTRDFYTKNHSKLVILGKKKQIKSIVSK